MANQKGHSSPNVYNPNENLSNNNFGEVSPTATNFKSSKLFNCPYCGKHFLNNSYMQQHIRIHTGERPFQCNICHATFTQKGNLKVHIRVHTGDKPFKCSLCDYSTIESSNLKRHMKRHNPL